MLKQTETSPFFDFYKKDIKKNKTNFKKKLSTGFSIFLGIQLILGGYNLFRSQNYINSMIEQSTQIYTDYAAMHKAIIKGDQNKSIELFTKIKYQNTAVADLLISGSMNVIKRPMSENVPVEYSYKLTPQTIGILNSIYENNWNSGIMAQQRENDNIKCLIGDFTCYVGRYFVQDKMNQYSQVVYKKIQASHYNNTHYDEFLKWQESYLTRAKTGTFLDDERTPGQKYVDNLK